jgi:hypothetical protein
MDVLVLAVTAEHLAVVAVALFYSLMLLSVVMAPAAQCV